MARPDSQPVPPVRSTTSALQQESDLVVAIVRTALIILAVLAPFILGATVVTRLAMRLSVLGAIAYNLVTFILAARRVHIRGMRLVMVLADTLLVTAWVYLTWSPGPGHVGSPLFPFYYVIIIISALWFAVPGALSAAGLITVLYLGVLFQISGYDPFALIDALYRDIAFIFLVALVTGYLVDTHKREREQWTRSQVLLAQYQERFRAAQEVYELLIPAETPRVPGLDIAARWRPALQEGAGDFYDVVSPTPGRAVIVIADVSGKHSRGALKLPLFKAAFLAAAQVWTDPGEMLAQVNRIVYPLLQPEMFISACILTIDIQEHRLTYANAGQDPPVFVRGASYDTQLLETGGLVLGVDERAKYPTETHTLHPGDTLCLYTDGITETRNPEGEEFGYDNLEGRVQAAVGLHLRADALAANIFDAVITHMRGNPPHDDMTLLAIRFVPDEAPNL
jgi:serine phosphatase RsbU (regulator of sigma subunit)